MRVPGAALRPPAQAGRQLLLRMNRTPTLPVQELTITAGASASGGRDSAAAAVGAALTALHRHTRPLWL
jgi:hypothetical protein